MATSQEKYQLVLEAREAAAEKIKKLNKQVNALGGPAMLKSQREIKKLEGQLKRLNTTTDQSKPVLSRFTKGIALGNLAAMGMARALGALTRFVKGTFEAALHHEKVWNDVAASLKRHRGEVDMNVKSIKTFGDNMQTLSGISDEVIGQAFQRLHDSNINVAQSLELTRASMDLAVAKGMDVVMVADLMGKSINSSTNALSRYGIMIDKSLPKQEQMAQLQQQVNDLFGGAAAARMETTAGKLSLMAERMGDLQESIGGVIAQSGGFRALLDIVSDAAKYWADFGQQGNLETIRAQIEDTNRQLDTQRSKLQELEGLNAIQKLTSDYGYLSDTIDGLQSKLIDLQYREQLMADQAAKNIKREAAERKALSEKRFTEIKASLKLPDPATDPDALAEIDRFNESLRIVMSSKITEPMLMADDILPNMSDIEAATSEINANIKANINADIVSKQQAGFGAAFTQIGAQGVNNLARALATGEGKISDVFKGMYEDFMTFFIKQAMLSILNVFIPGLGTALGGMFDTPKYDRMAMQQGEHFAHYFTQGVFSKMKEGSEFMSGIVPSASNMAMPAMAGAGSAPSGSMGSTINVTFSGNVLSSQFVEQQVAPMLRKLVTNGKSDLVLSPENVTGGRTGRGSYRRDVRVY